MRGLFVTGTDTGAGKTVVAAAITAVLRTRGAEVRALKPVITGLDEVADPDWPHDHELLALAAGDSPAKVALRRFGPAVSPHLATELARTSLDVAQLVDEVRAAGSREVTIVVEGVGGLLVPLARGWDVRRFAGELGLPLVVAARPGLGTINHTLLTLDSARGAGLTVAAVVLTPWPEAPGPIERSNLETIAELGSVEVALLPQVARGTPALLAAAGESLPIERWLMGEPGPRTSRSKTSRAAGPSSPPPPSGARLSSVYAMRPTEDLVAADRRHLWHPFTAQLDWCEGEQPLVIDHAEGTNLYDTEGRAYIDGHSSLWCNVHGHRHEAIDAAIAAQLGRVSHSTMLGLSHAPAIELAERLIAIAPPGLTRVFYSDSGATAVEIALKMAFQWWAQRGEPQRTRFICLENSYHGDTLGAVSVGGIDTFHALYHPLLFDTWQAPAGDPARLEQLLATHRDRVAAVVIEPLVQGAAGMLMQPDGYVRAVRELCDRYDTLLICDEVATGFGRTGAMFACELERVTPDLLCVGKGLTGGYLPLAATLATERVYEGFLGEPSESRTFFHGHTFTGNPLGCAAAIACLETFEREHTIEQMGPKIELLARALAERVAPLPAVSEVRQRGFMIGIELVQRPARERLGHAVTLAARRRGAVIRPLGDVIVLMPAPAMSAADLEGLVSITAASIAEVTSGLLSAAA